jgi:hypothetical protein
MWILAMFAVYFPNALAVPNARFMLKYCSKNRSLLFTIKALK